MSDEQVASIVGAPALSLAQQADAVDYVMRLIDICRGISDRDTHRAYWLGGRILGLRYEHACRIYKFARIEGAAAALKRCSHSVTAGEYVGDVYFAEAPNGWIKIGHSHDVPERLQAVSRAIRQPLRLIETRPGFMLNEHVFHVLGRAAWLGGELYDAAQLERLPAFAFLDRRVKREQVEA